MKKRECLRARYSVAGYKPAPCAPDSGNQKKTNLVLVFFAVLVNFGENCFSSGNLIFFVAKPKALAGAVKIVR